MRLLHLTEAQFELVLRTLHGAIIIERQCAREWTDERASIEAKRLALLHEFISGQPKLEAPVGADIPKQTVPRR